MIHRLRHNVVIASVYAIAMAECRARHADMCLLLDEVRQVATKGIRDEGEHMILSLSGIALPDSTAKRQMTRTNNLI